MRDKIYKFGQTISVISASAIVLITVVDVVLRYFMNSSIFGSTELTNMLLAIVIGAGLIVVAKDRLHITVDLFRPAFERCFGARYERWTQAWEFLGTFVLGALMTRHAWHVLISNETTPVLEFPIGWIYVCVAVMVFLAVALMMSTNFSNESSDGRDS